MKTAPQQKTLQSGFFFICLYFNDYRQDHRVAVGFVVEERTDLFAEIVFDVDPVDLSVPLDSRSLFDDFSDELADFHEQIF